MTADTADAVVIGSGPNGLVAAITLARKGWDVIVLERNEWVGGAVRSAEITQPGFVHDVYSAFYGLLHASPAFRALGLDSRIEWAQFDTPIGAMVAPDRGAFVARGDVDRTASSLGIDADAWREVSEWWRRIGSPFFQQMLAPVGAVRPGLRFARAAGVRGLLPTARTMLQPLEDFVRERFVTEEARALFSSGC